MEEEREDGRYLLLMVLPPADDGPGIGLPTETLFVIDVSGSMEGPSILRAREALDAALVRLRPDDTFNILTFAEDRIPFRDHFLPAEEAEVRQARRWVSRLPIRGGTRIDLALERAVEMMGASGGERTRRIVFLTDGGADNEEAILDILRRGLGSTRVHALGIGAAPNRYLLREMGRLGRGLCTFIADAGAVVNEIDAFLERLDRPVWTDLDLEWDGPDSIELFPDPLPDLHAGEPLFASIRVAPGEPIRRLVLRGRSRAGAAAFDVELASGATVSSGVAARWARARVQALDDLLRRGADEAEVRAEVVATSLRFGIVTRYTSLVAVEEFPTATGEARQVRVPAGSLAGVLPRGGTDGPLLARLGAVLTVAGGVLWLLGTVPGRRSPPAPGGSPEEAPR